MQTQTRATYRNVDAWTVRAVELAVERHLSHTARLAAPGSLMAQYWLVPSRSGGSEHVVRVRSDDVPRCDCVAARHDRPCSHAGAVLIGLAQVAEMLSPRGIAAQRRYERFCEDLEVLSC